MEEEQVEVKVGGRRRCSSRWRWKLTRGMKRCGARSRISQEREELRLKASERRGQRSSNGGRGRWGRGLDAGERWRGKWKAADVSGEEEVERGKWKAAVVLGGENVEGWKWKAAEVLGEEEVD